MVPGLPPRFLLGNFDFTCFLLQYNIDTMYHLSANRQQVQSCHLMGVKGQIYVFFAVLRKVSARYKTLCRAQDEDCEDVQIV